MENTAPTIERLEDFVDHLLSLQAVPALRSSLEVPSILESMLDAILRVLCLDFVHIKLNSIALDGAPIEMTRLAAWGHQESLVSAIRQLLDCLPAADGPLYPVVVPNPVGEGDVTIVSCRVGVLCDIGVVVAGARRADFPTRTDMLLLRIATNQAAMGLQETHRLNEQRRSNEDIERLVAVRTVQLTAANDNFKKEVLKHKLAEDAFNLSEERFRRYFDLGLVGAWRSHRPRRAFLKSMTNSAGFWDTSEGNCCKQRGRS